MYDIFFSKMKNSKKIYIPKEFMNKEKVMMDKIKEKRLNFKTFYLHGDK